MGNERMIWTKEKKNCLVIQCTHNPFFICIYFWDSNSITAIRVMAPTTLNKMKTTIKTIFIFNFCFLKFLIQKSRKLTKLNKNVKS